MTSVLHRRAAFAPKSQGGLIALLIADRQQYDCMTVLLRASWSCLICTRNASQCWCASWRSQQCHISIKTGKENPRCFRSAGIVLALPIFPVSHPTSIFGENELNFCVRYGNRWTLIPISTNYSVRCALKTGHHETAFLRDTSEPAYYCRSSARLISISQLNTLLCLHP